MDGEVRGTSSVVAGEFRTIQNFLGSRGATMENATYIPPEPQHVPDYITNLERYINEYQEHLPENTVNKARQITHTTTLIDVIDMIFKYPIFTTAKIRTELDIPASTLNSYLSKLCEAKIIYSDDAVRNRKYYFYDLISIIS